MPAGAGAKLFGPEATTAAPGRFAALVRRAYVRFIWSEAAPDHINRAAQENEGNRLLRFIAKISFDSVGSKGFTVAIFFRLKAWSMGARRRSASEPTMLAALGDPFQVIAVHIPSRSQPPIRSWWPSSENKWRTAKNYSYFDGAGIGLTKDIWGHLPNLGAPELRHELFPLENTEILIDFPTYIPPPAEVRYYVNRGEAPLPPPEKGEAVPRTTHTAYAGDQMPQKMRG